VAAQNERTRAVLDALPGRAALHGRLSDLLRAGSSTGPRVAGDLVLSLDRWGDHDQAVLVARSLKEPGGEVRVLVDPHAATGDATTAIDWFHPSPDGRLVAYGTSAGGDENSVLRVLDVATGEHSGEEIADTRAAAVAWLPDASAFAYTRYPAGAQYGRRVWWHRLGDDPAEDDLVFGDLPDETAWPEVSASRDGRWLVVSVSLGWTRTDVHLIDRETGDRTAVVEGEEALTFLEVAGDRLVGTTTLGAPRGRVVAAPLDDPTPDRWETLLPEGEAVIEMATVAGPSVLVATTRSAASRLVRLPLDGGEPEGVDLPGIGSLAGMDGDGHGGRELALLSFTSFTRPPALFRWTPGELEPWSDLESAVDADAYVVEQVRYPSTDGTEVAMFVVRSAGDPGWSGGGPRPTILTGYGGFAITYGPAYGPHMAAWCDGGGRYAVACIRGGSEEGEEWHRAGMREHKQQVFDDFHAAGDWLVANGVTTHDTLALRGGSNGGLLMGAAITQRPDLARAVHCAVPLLDMVRYNRFLLAKLWVPEYGDPDVPEEFGWLHAYSPYHHVEDGTCYPATLITTGEEDSRVDPCHARKFAALLEEATSCGDERPVLLRVETRAGHGQGKPVTKQADELTDVLSFLGWQLGWLGSEGP
jgi:prolyl oligopeptidase